MMHERCAIRGFGLAGFVGAWMLAGSASASLIGDEITVSLVEEGILVGSVRVIVRDGPEFVGPGLGLDPGESFDITADSIIAVSAGPLGANSRYRFSDLDWLPEPRRITGFDLTTDIAGLGDEDISFGADFIEGEAGADAVFGAGTATIVLRTELQPVSAVPEPGSTLGLLGLAGIGVMRRMTRRARLARALHDPGAGNAR